MLNLGTVQSSATLEIRRFKDGIRKIEREGDKGASNVERRFGGMGRRLAQIGAAAAAAVGASLLAIGTKSLKTAAKFEDLRVSMDTLNRSAVEGARNFDRLVDTAANTPFQLTELAQAQNTLQGFGLSADEAYDSLINIGDIAAVSSGNIQGIGIAFGQAAAEGKVMTRDIRQFINQGVPMITLLANTMGVAEDQILDLASQGEISFEILQQAFRDATSEGGLFEDGMLKAQNTLSGAFSNLKDNSDILLASIGSLISDSANLEGNIRKLSGILGDAAEEGSEFRDVLSGLFIVMDKISKMKGRLQWMPQWIQDVQTGGLTAIGRKFGSEIIDKLREIGKEKRNVDNLGFAVADLYEQMNQPSVLLPEEDWTMVSHIDDASDATDDLSSSTRQVVNDWVNFFQLMDNMSVNWDKTVLSGYNEVKSSIDNNPIKPMANIEDPSMGIDYMKKSLEELVNMSPDSDFSHRLFPPGSLGALQDRLSTLREDLLYAFDPAEISRLKEEIGLTESQIESLTGTATESSQAMMGFANTLGDVFAQAALHGKDLKSTLDGILKQLAAKAFVTGIGALLTGGASLAGKGFFGTLFGGSFHGGGLVPGSGEKMIMAKGGERVLTPEQYRSITSTGNRGGMQKVVIQNKLDLDGREVWRNQRDYNYKLNR